MNDTNKKEDIVSTFRKICSFLAAAVLLVTSISLTGCGTAATNDSGSSEQQSNTAAQSGQQPSNQQGQQQPGGRQGGLDMSAMLAKVATILGISTEKVTSAYEQAQESLGMQKPAEGQRPSQSDNGTPPAPPTDGQQGQPPSGGQMPNMTALYDKMAELLGISSDTIASAFQQAQKELFSK
jgi:hypothetical protein